MVASVEHDRVGASSRRSARAAAHVGRSMRRTSPRLPFGRRTEPAGHALLTVLVALALGSLLNVQSLREAAERQPFGLRRDVALVLVAPLDLLSEVLGLDEPRVFVDAGLGRRDAVIAAGGAAEGSAAGGGSSTSTDGGAADTGSGGGPVGGGLAAPGTATEALADAPRNGGAPPTAPPAQREFGMGDPLRTWVIGDSLTEQLGPALRDRLARTGVAQGHHEFHYSSGLTRPDFYDWPRRATEIVQQSDPDAWVVMVGGNDAQDLRSPEGRFIPFASEAWEEEYRARVGTLMDLLVEGGRRVVWVGQPVMRDADFDRRMAYLDGIYADEARSRGAVAFVDARPLFVQDAGGGYAAYLPGADGLLQLMRLGDGIHLTRAGAERLSDAVVAALDAQWHLATVAATAATATPDAAARRDEAGTGRRRGEP